MYLYVLAITILKCNFFRVDRIIFKFDVLNIILMKIVRLLRTINDGIFIRTFLFL